MTTISPDIFKAYDVRGVYGEEMDGEVAYLLGRAFARVLAQLRGKDTSALGIGLGRDMRLTSPEMAERVREGLLDEGTHVIDAGMIGTEMLYYLVGSRGLDGGAMVTASHNPKAWTGVKLVREGALAFSGDAGIAEVRAEIERGMPKPPGGGTLEHLDIYDRFHRHVLSFIEPDRVTPMRVVVDGGNGMAGPMVGPLLERLDLDLVTTYWEPDGTFPDHEPNPLLEENRRFIVDKVVGEGAELGIAWDGDADRCFFIDETGTFVDGDFLTAMLATSQLRKNPGAAVLYDVARAARSRHDHRERRDPARQPRRPRVLQDRDAGARRRVRRRGLRPLLLPRLLVRRFGDDPGVARARADLGRGPPALRARRRVPRALFHLRRDQLRGRGPGREDARARGAQPGRARSRGSTASPWTTRSGTSTCGHRTPSRCCASTSSRWSPVSTWRRRETRSWS